MSDHESDIRERLDRAMEGIDADLAAKDPGVALSRDSLIRFREQSGPRPEQPTEDEIALLAAVLRLADAEWACTPPYPGGDWSALSQKRAENLARTALEHLFDESEAG